jgi:molybdenum cofactor biosynthesis protein A
MLVDQHYRVHNYLRISLTERCNLRCKYCMPAEGISLRDKSHFMTSEEIVEMAKIFVGLGVNKIRITGGEPLIKKDIANILTQLSDLPVEIAITTNAVVLDKHLDLLGSLGIRKLNISLDSLNEQVFNELSRRNYFQQIVQNILLAIDKGFEVHINVVVMKGINDNELVDFVAWTKELPIAVRFIEFMPFDDNQWSRERVVGQAEMEALIFGNYGREDLIKLNDAFNSTSRNYKVMEHRGSFGFISTVTQPFCNTCNRIRLTADGKIKNCLFSADETDLLTPLRAGHDIIPLIQNSIYTKKPQHAGVDFNKADSILPHRVMTAIGG